MKGGSATPNDSPTRVAFAPGRKPNEAKAGSARDLARPAELHDLAAHRGALAREPPGGEAHPARGVVEGGQVREGTVDPQELELHGADRLARREPAQRLPDERFELRPRDAVPGEPEVGVRDSDRALRLGKPGERAPRRDVLGDEAPAEHEREPGGRRGDSEGELERPPRAAPQPEPGERQGEAEGANRPHGRKSCQKLSITTTESSCG
jgi:hypothetical protein